MTAPPRPLFSFPQGKKTIPPRLVLSCHIVREISHLSPLAPPMQGKAITPPGQLGKGNRHPPGTSQPSLPRWPAPPPGEGNPTPTPPSRLTQVLQMKTPAQRSVLAKGPNFAVTPRQPPNLEYITAIEAACTKLSQQDAEELRANINRVLRYSHPPNPT